MPGESKTSRRRLAAAQRQRNALELRIGGASFDQIAEQLNYASKSGAYHAVMAALRRVPAPEADTYRSINLERLNRIRLAIAQAVRRGELLAIDREIKLQQEEAKLLGLYAPEKIDLTVTRERLVKVAMEEGLDEVEAVALVEEMLRQGKDL